MLKYVTLHKERNIYIRNLNLKEIIHIISITYKLENILPKFSVNFQAIKYNILENLKNLYL